MTLRLLEKGFSFRQMVHMARMAVDSQRKALTLTLKAIYRRFGPIYLNREPTEFHLRSVVSQYDSRCFPGFMGQLECMQWRNCPVAYKGQFHNSKYIKLGRIRTYRNQPRKDLCWTKSRSEVVL